jgi:type I restriction enzyme R subunit
VLEALLDKYADEGIENIEDMKVLQVKPLDQFGSPLEIVKLFGGKRQYLKSLAELEYEIYKIAV